MSIVIFSSQKHITQYYQNYLLKIKDPPPIKIVQTTSQSILEQAKKHIEHGTKIFLARGANYRLLKEKVTSPVLNIPSTYEEIMRTHMEAKKLSNKIVMIGSDSIFQMIKIFQDLSGEAFEAVTFSTSQEIDDIVKKYIAKGYDTFVGGVSVQTSAEKYGVNYLSYQIDSLSLDLALDDAIKMLKFEEEREQKYELVKSMMNFSTEAIVLFNGSDKLLSMSKTAEKILAKMSNRTIQNLLLTPDYKSKLHDNNLPIVHQIIEINKNTFVLNIKPLFVNHIYNRAVVTLTESKKVAQTEKKLRNEYLTKGHVARYSFQHIIGKSPIIKKTIEVSKRYANSDSPVLIFGESGTGKELFAQSIHNYSCRKHGPFVAINCAALSNSVLESELFGYVRGAFTGARNEGKVGIFESAHEGTVFLDEIGELDIDIQAKLLRVLQEKEIVRLGDNKIISVDVRVISATNRYLPERIKEYKFREDLFYRLAVLNLRVPPLSERTEDIPLIVRNYLAQKQSLVEITETAMNVITNQPMFGNIRHLLNLIERCLCISEEKVITDNIVKEAIQNEFESVTQRDMHKKPAVNDSSTESQTIRKVLERNFGNRQKSAQELGISTVTLWRKMKKYQLL